MMTPTSFLLWWWFVTSLAQGHQHHRSSHQEWWKICSTRWAMPCTPCWGAPGTSMSQGPGVLQTLPKCPPFSWNTSFGIQGCWASLPDITKLDRVHQMKPLSCFVSRRICLVHWRWRGRCCTPWLTRCTTANIHWTNPQLTSWWRHSKSSLWYPMSQVNHFHFTVRHVSSKPLWYPMSQVLYCTVGILITTFLGHGSGNVQCRY